jgi:EmrB/QacA subfamily drug resistance transporter
VFKDKSLQINTGTGNVNSTVVLIVACLSVIIIAFMFSAFNVALPIVNQQFQADAVLLNWIIIAFVLMNAIFSVPFGRIADIVGVKKMFIIGVIIFMLASAAVVFVQSGTDMVILRAAQGFGTAMMNGPTMAMLSAAFPGKKRGRAFGLYSASVYAGLSVGPLLGGLITEHLTWKVIFLLNIPISLTIIFLTLWKVKTEWSECKGEKFDYIGTGIFGIALGAIMYGFSLLPNIIGGVLTALGILGVLGFLAYENRVESPVINVSLFKNNRAFIFSNLAALINYSATSGISFLVSLYLQYNKGFSADKAGLIMIAQPIVQTLVSPFAGRLSEKIEARIVASIGMAMLCVGLIYFVFLSPDTPTVLIIINLILLGAGFGLFASPNTNAIMSSVIPKYYSVAGSVTSTMRTIGQTLSMGIIMILMALIIGRVVIEPETYNNFLWSARVAFGVFAVLCIAGVFASLARGKMGQEPGVNPKIEIKS